MPDPVIKQLDYVELVTTKNISYLSAPPGNSPSPHGRWLVAGIVEGDDVLVSKGKALALVPLRDLVKAESYSIDSLEDNIRKMRNHGKKENNQENNQENI